MGTIKSFKKFIEESIWSDMQDRSAGVTKRKEDDVNLLDYDGLYDYIKSKYSEKVFCIEKDYFFQKSETICVDPIKNVSLYLKRLRDGSLEDILLSWVHVNINHPFLLKLEERFFVSHSGVQRRIIKEKDGTCTNQTYIDVIDFFLEYVDNIVVNESIWSDMQDRSAGDTVRKEDEYDIDEKELERSVDTCIKTYVIGFIYYDKYDGSSDTFLKCIQEWNRNICQNAQLYDRRFGKYVEPIKVIPSYVKKNWETGKSYKSLVDKKMSEEEKKVKDTGFIKKPGESISDTLSKWFDENFEKLGDDFCEEIEEYNERYHNEGGSMSVDLDVEDWWDNLEYIEQVEIYQDYMKKTNESIWSDMQDRSAGDVVRKEDEMTQDDFDAVDDFIFGFATRVVWDGMKYSLTNFLKYIDENPESLDCDIKRVKKYVEDNWCKGICDDVEAAIEQEEKEREQVMYESIWSDMQDRSTGDVVRKEDEMNDDDFLMLRGLAEMFRNFMKRSRYASRRNTCDNFIKYIERRKEEHFWTNVSDEAYDKVIRFVQKNWGDCTGIQEFMDKYLSNINECDGVPGGLTPADVGGMGPAYFPGPNGEPGSGDLPSPTGIVYKQVAPFDSFIKIRKQKRKKKKFRKEDEPCVHSENPPIYSHVDDFRDYVDRTYDNIDKKNGK